jgi:hypothetical protein
MALPDEKDILKPEVAAAEAAEDFDNVEIEIVDDTPEADRGRKPLERPVEEPTEEELSAYSDGVKKRIKELTHARHDERRAREAIEREKAELERVAQAMADENRRLKQHYDASSEQLATSALSAADAAVEAARRKLKEAHESFDTDAIVAAQEELADAKLEQANAKRMRKGGLQPQPEVVQPEQQAPRPLDERTLRWQAKNQWFGDPEHEGMTLFSLGVHKELVRKGYDPRSESYFEQVDARMRQTFPNFFGKETPDRTESASKRPSSVVAPGTRASGPRKIQLTPTQLALARKYNLTPQQYAAEVLKLERSNG